MANLREVAERAGVSTSTVSHVVNGTRFVERATKERVERAIAELGFRPNRIARGLRTGSTRTVGVLGVTAQDRLFAEVVRGVEGRCYERGYEVLLGFVEYPSAPAPDAEEVSGIEGDFAGRVAAGDFLVPTPGEHFRACKLDGAKEGEIVSKFLSREVDALILNSGEDDAALAEYVAAAGRPVALYQRRLTAAPCDSFCADDVGGTRAAARRLLALGHRRIAVIYGYSWPGHSARGRFRAYAEALAEAGIPADPRLIRQGLYDPGLAGRQAAALLALPDPPTAFLCWSDLMALAVIDAARGRGLSCPGDVSVVGFDDLDFAPYSAPRLSTIRQAKAEAGRMMADRILDAAERAQALAAAASGKAPPPPPRPDAEPRDFLIPAEYIERESVGPARRRG